MPECRRSQAALPLRILHQLTYQHHHHNNHHGTTNNHHHNFNHHRQHIINFNNSSMNFVNNCKVTNLSNAWSLRGQSLVIHNQFSTGSFPTPLHSRFRGKKEGLLHSANHFHKSQKFTLVRSRPGLQLWQGIAVRARVLSTHWLLGKSGPNRNKLPHSMSCHRDKYFLPLRRGWLDSNIHKVCLSC